MLSEDLTAVSSARIVQLILADLVGAESESSYTV